MKFCLNAGHGQKNNGTFDSGAVSKSGFTEASETIEVVNILASYIKSSGNEVLIIQDGDLEDVTSQANDWGASYFISVHCNSAEDSSAHGIETFALSSGGQGDKLAHAVQSNLISATNLTNRGVKYSNFWVLRKTDMSAILTEIGFISNQNEENLMKDANWDIKVAKAIYKGICEVTGIKYVENQSNQLQGGIKKVKNLVIYLYPEDEGCAMNLARHLQCPCSFYPKQFTNDLFDLVENIIQVGGSSVNPKVKLITGNEFDDTMVSYLRFIGKIK